MRKGKSSKSEKMLEIKRGLKRNRRNSNKMRAELRLKFLRERIEKQNVSKKSYNQFMEMMNQRVAEEQARRRENIPVVQTEEKIMDSSPKKDEGNL